MDDSGKRTSDPATAVSSCSVISSSPWTSHRNILYDAALAIRGNSIAALGPRAQISAAYRAATIVDATGCLVIPGLIDAHTHIPMTLFRGLADDLPLHSWLKQHVWPAEKKHINPKTVRWASRLGVAELLRSGVTTLCDMYFYENEVRGGGR